MVLLAIGLGLFLLALLFFIPVQWGRRTEISRNQLNSLVVAQRLDEMAVEASDEAHRQVLEQEAKRDFIDQSGEGERDAQPLSRVVEPPRQEGRRAYWLAASAFCALVVVVALLSGHVSNRVYWQQQLESGEITIPSDAVLSRQTLVTLYLQQRAKLAKEPQQPSGWATLSEWALQLGQGEDAINAATRAHQQDKDNPAFALQYAKVKVMTGSGSESARQILLSQAKYSPLNPEVFVLLGVDAYQQAHYQSALAFWSIAQSNGAAKQIPQYPVTQYIQSALQKTQASTAVE
ncbi:MULTISPECIES: hypothetical protein [unclassified Vibrio]|uniref:Tetratricopeptide repeat protein n=1 Tax=Vibrio sp. HB236076 TaxID=3232307 RepID=A0AB39HIA2_9VIBR|nr:hypothetical protein [Vibrio sp. HB161653]MDP5254766.1 hypothetical protein [Vibrio sp. HB161653]